MCPIFADGLQVKSCAIVTTTANDLVAPIHNRMPVILPRDAEAIWLDPGIQDPGVLTALFHPYQAELMEAYQVSTLVNFSGHNNPTSIEPVPGSVGLL